MRFPKIKTNMAAPNNGNTTIQHETKSEYDAAPLVTKKRKRAPKYLNELRQDQNKTVNIFRRWITPNAGVSE